MAPEISLAASADRRRYAHFPWHVALLALAIAGIGLWNLAAASRVARAPVWIAQSWWMGAGLLVALALTLFDYRALQRLAWPFYGGVVALLLLVFWKGRTVMGARRWIGIGPVNVQPSELAKLAVILALALWFHVDDERRKDARGLLGLAPPLAVTLVPALLVLKQPDLGTALVVLAVGITMLLFARVRFLTLGLLALAASGAALLAFPHLKPYQRKRLETFLNPEGDALGAGYHALQSKIAVGSGQGLGKGWGQGTQTMLSFLPEQHTDFIFSVWAEEHGFVGCALLLSLYFALVGSALEIAGNARDRFGHFLAIGVTAMIFWQTTINVGMVTGALPVVGVTLPLMSYGGSSVLVVFAGLGLLANVGMRRFVN